MKIIGEMRYYSVCSIIWYYKNDALSFDDTCHSMHSRSNKGIFTSRTWIKKMWKNFIWYLWHNKNYEIDIGSFKVSLIIVFHPDLNFQELKKKGFWNKVKGQPFLSLIWREKKPEATKIIKNKNDFSTSFNFEVAIRQ